MTSALSIKNVAKTYSNGTSALDGVSLEISAGDFFALLGPNGAGKTSLIGTIVGLVTKTDGSIAVFGTDTDHHPEKAKRYIGLVPQEFNFNIFEKVIDIVVNQAGYYGISRSVAIPRAEKILKDVGLYEKRNEEARTLSGGMKRRLLIARALIHQPKFLILDEPTAGVDIELRRGMWDYLKRLTDEGVTILLTTHYLEEAEQLAKHVAIIHHGKIVKTGTLKHILETRKTETSVLSFLKPISEKDMISLASYNPKKIDETSIEVEVEEGQGIGEVVFALEKVGTKVQGVRGKSSRLEEVFMHLTSRAKE